jgi:hypothetical protein
MNQEFKSHVDLPRTMDDKIHYLLFKKKIYFKTRLEEPPIHPHTKKMFFTPLLKMLEERAYNVDGFSTT